ncbi:MAG: helicase, partial [Clostridia bacterium]|nr:helicase [Clostridia bacterium]
MITNEQMNIEENHLKETYNTICNQIEKSSLVLQNAKNTLEEQLKYKDEDYYDMDEEERVSQDLLIKNLEDVIVVSNQKINILNNLKKSCYFGSVVFSSNNINKVYFGINSLLDENATFPLICDWRAPIASLFYNNELGKAVYSSKEGEVSGEIFEKRQFKVKEDNLVYAFDSNLTISDEILKQELGNAKSDKMTNIVATIQKEQNEIIRNTNLTSTIIQGVAGSGKTSIALHRAAFLLYNFRNQIRAENILVFSPADVFSKYIENVLPELGEEMVKSTTILNLAKEELLGYLYETAPEFFARLYNNQAAINDYIYRSGFEYVEDLKQFLKSNNFFEGADFKLGNETISATYLNNLYQEFNKVKS